MATMRDDDIVFVLKHGVGKKLCGANIFTAERINRATRDVESDKPRTMVVGVGDAEFLAEVSEADVTPTPSHTNIVRAYTCLVQHVRTEVVGPVDHAIFQASLAEGI